MITRELGSSGLHLTPLVLGTNVFGWTAAAATSYRLLDAFVAGGGNTLDTADVYSAWVPGHAGGESETIIGEWLRRRGRRDDVLICTKVGSQMGPRGAAEPAGAARSGLSARWIRQAVEDSLRRLGTDYIDLYQSHKDDLSCPVEEPLSVYAELIREGKVRAIGASNFSAARLAAALRASETQHLPRYQSLQPEYNLYDRADYERELAPLCATHHLGVIPYYGLAAGFLTGKYRTAADLQKSARGAGIGARYLNARGHRILRALDAVAARHAATPGEIALAWLLTRVTAPIASASCPEQVPSLLRALEISLSPDDQQTLDTASA